MGFVGVIILYSLGFSAQKHFYDNEYHFRRPPQTQIKKTEKGDAFPVDSSRYEDTKPQKKHDYLEPFSNE